MEYLIHLAILVGIYLILAQSFNLTFGIGSLFNLAHISVYAIGAYITALLSTEFAFGIETTLPLSMLGGALFAVSLSVISIRLAGDYFAIGTLAFHSMTVALLINWKSLTHGVLGIPGIPRPEVFGVSLDENKHFLLLVAALVLITFIILRVTLSSSYARSLKAQAENEKAALTLALDVTKLRAVSFMISSAFAGMAGSLFAYYLNYIDPSSFSLSEIVLVLTIVVLGRPGSFWGVTAAAIFLILLPEPLRFIDIPSSILGPMRQLIYALILFAVVYARRSTLFPKLRQV